MRNWTPPRRLGSLLLAAVLSACGLEMTAPMPVPLPPAGTVQPTPAQRPSYTTVQTKKPRPKPTTGKPAPKTSPAAPAPSRPSELTLYEQAINRYLGLRSYTAEVQSYGKAQGKDIGATARMYWKAPNRLRVEILDTNITKGDNTVIVDSGSGAVRAKAPGWWPFPVSVERTDSKLRLPGGPRFDEATVGGVLGLFQAQGAQIEAMGEIDFLGRTVAEFHVRNQALTSRGLTLVRVGIDPATRLLVFCEQQNAQGIASQIVFTALTPDAPVADDLFDL